MKVAFIGTHGVGKTTLCYDLAACLKKRDVTVELVREVARECPLPINRETTLTAQSWILHTQIAWELAAEAKSEVVVCDRAALDNFCYLKRAGGAGARESALEAIVASWTPTYDVLVKVPGPDAHAERTATLDKGKVGDTNKLMLKMRTNDYKTAKTMKLSLEVWPKD